MVIVALAILILGVFCLLVSEIRLEEELIDELNLPTKFNPPGQEGSEVACIFIERARGKNVVFRQLLGQGKISEVFLEVFVNASGNVSVQVFNLWCDRTFFNETGRFFNETVKVDVIGTNATVLSSYWWIVRNAWFDAIDVSGYVRLKAEMPKNFHPYYGAGTLFCLSGVSLAIYGFLTKPAKKG